MTENKFYISIEEKLKEKMGNEVHIKLQQVKKNNNVLYHGLVIQKEECNIAPTIYLDSFYSLYEKGKCVEEIVEEIIQVYNRGDVKGSLDMDFFREFDKVKNKIAYKLINAERNKELLERVPHVLMLDLAICFYYAFYDESLGEGMILIHNTHMEMWKTNHEELMKLAQKNTKRLFPSVLIGMNALLKDMMLKDECAGMYVLTNEQKCQGAAVMLYSEVLEKAAKKLGGNFFILPSSIHEVILLKDHGYEDAESLKEMIAEANRTQVAEEEILSDYPYYFDCAENKISRLEAVR